MNANRFRYAFALLCAAMTVFMSSCSDNVFDAFSRTTDDPSDCILDVECLKGEYITLRWEEDPACDRYVLLRTDDGKWNEPASYEVVYSGTGCEYRDEKVREGAVVSKYVYRLDKVRGNKTFEGTKLGHGVYAPSNPEYLEKNDSMETACELIYRRTSCLYSYKFGDEYVLENADWYYVDMPAGIKNCTLEIEYNNDNNAGTAALNYCIPGLDKESSKISKDDICLSNDDGRLKRAYIRITPISEEVRKQQDGILIYTLTMKDK